MSKRLKRTVLVFVSVALFATAFAVIAVNSEMIIAEASSCNIFEQTGILLSI